MPAWLKRFGLHLAAAVGATGIFVAAAAVGASQTRQQTASVAVPAVVTRTRTPGPLRRPSVVAVTPSPSPNASAASNGPGSAAAVAPERSLAGTVEQVLPDGLLVMGVGGREWRVTPAPGALIRLNGKTARLDAIALNDTLVILGQAQPGPGNRFVAHAITARHK